MLWLNTGNSVMIHIVIVFLDTQQTWFSLIIRAISINNHIDTSLSNVTCFDCYLVYFCLVLSSAKKILSHLPSGLSLYEKLSAIKCECSLFYSPKRGHKGNHVQSSPSGYYSVSEFARDHYSVASCYPIHLLYPSFISPQTSLTCKYVLQIKAAYLCMDHLSWKTLFISSYLVLLISKCPDFRNCGTALNIKWHHIIIHGKNRYHREFFLPWTVVGSHLS